MVFGKRRGKKGGRGEVSAERPRRRGRVWLYRLIGGMVGLILGWQAAAAITG